METVQHTSHDGERWHRKGERGYSLDRTQPIKSNPFQNSIERDLRHTILITQFHTFISIQTARIGVMFASWLYQRFKRSSNGPRANVPTDIPTMLMWRKDERICNGTFFYLEWRLTIRKEHSLHVNCTPRALYVSSTSASCRIPVSSFSSFVWWPFKYETPRTDSIYEISNDQNSSKPCATSSSKNFGFGENWHCDAVESFSARPPFGV
jgi:hypothetical protein